MKTIKHNLKIDLQFIELPFGFENCKTGLNILNTNFENFIFGQTFNHRSK